MSTNRITDPDAFERLVTQSLQHSGWTVTKVPAGTRTYDLEAVRGRERVAVQCKCYRVPVKVPQVERFLAFMESADGRPFTQGFLVCSTQFTDKAKEYYWSSDAEEQPRIRLATFRDEEILWLPKPPGEEPTPAQPQDPTTYVGVFTCKGGVGKTTVSAHLAGAMALSGYDVTLVELDPQKNLFTLLGEGVLVPNRNRLRPQTITIYNVDEWDFTRAPGIRLVVCDCSPAFESNPREMLQRFDYCIIPTTLNPLGLNKNGHVIKNTIEALRKVNQKAHLFVLINNYLEDDTLRGKILREAYWSYFADLARRDPKFHFIDPEEVAIRSSKQLFYWGYHLYSGGRPQLAFADIGGRCFPRADFLNLLEYLQEHSTLQPLRSA
ncbi:MAG TPA: restriction endonuclease [Chthoniobacterales bacterium]